MRIAFAGNKAAIILLPFFLSACAPPAVKLLTVGGVNLDAPADQVYRGGRTYMTFSAHGTQVEYLGKDGSTELWYPGNTVLVPGKWKLQANDPVTTHYGDSICYLYPSNSYNPIDHTFGGKWECEPARYHSTRVVDIVAGDPFGLSKRQSVPYILPRERTDLATLLARLKR